MGEQQDIATKTSTITTRTDEIEVQFEKMQLPTEILEGNDDSGYNYHPFKYPSEDSCEMAYSPPRSQPIPIRQVPNQQVIAQPRIQVPPMSTAALVPPQQLAMNNVWNNHHHHHHHPQPFMMHQAPIGHAIGPRGIPVPSVAVPVVPVVSPVGNKNNNNNNHHNFSPFYRSNSQFF